MDGTGAREEGRLAFAQGLWLECYERLRAAGEADEAPLEPADLERLAISAYLTGREAESTEAWAAAHQAWLDRGEHPPAVRCAFWAGFGLVQRGEMAQGGGWLARAQSLVDQHSLDCVERGYLLLPEALMALANHDFAGALSRCEEATALARRFDDRDLVAMGTLGRGQVLLRSGRAVEGMRLFDEAMVAVTVGETSAVVSGIIYCAVIDACQQAFDLRRAREWTSALGQWCAQQPDLVPYRGQCLVHRAQILQVGGAWDEAMTEARQARDRLNDPPNPAVGMAYYELGELHRLRGELKEAEAAYRSAHGAGRVPQPGLALLRLNEGRLDSAVAALERALDDSRDHVSRVRLLPAYTEVLLAAGRTEDARRAADELSDLAGGTPGVLEAVAAQSRGRVFLAAKDPAPALEALHAALRIWQDMNVPYEAAQVRVLLADAHLMLGDHEAAELEREAARAVFEQLGAAPALAGLDERVRQSASAKQALVTPRELDVLRLVAAGRTNREIAGEMSISERTVERHLENIFTKLDVPNRAAATAYAFHHGLV